MKTMNLRFAALMAAMMMTIIAFADTQDWGGRVLDEKGEPMPFVNVVLLSLPDSAFVQGATTDAQGNIIYEMDITNFEDLKGAVLNYRNDEAYISTFTMRIPVELDYAWGTLTAYLVINVKDTGSTTPQ